MACLKREDINATIDNFASIKDATRWECDQCGNVNKIEDKVCISCGFKYCPNC